MISAIGFRGTENVVKAQNGDRNAIKPNLTAREVNTYTPVVSSSEVRFGAGVMQRTTGMAKVLFLALPLLVLSACDRKNQDDEKTESGTSPAVGTEVSEKVPPVQMERPKSASSPASIALYNELNQGANLERIEALFAEGATLSDSVSGYTLLVKGLLTAARSGNLELADAFLSRATAEELGRQNVTDMTIPMLLAGMTLTEEGAEVFGRVVAAMQEKGVPLTVKDNFQWHVAHHLAYFGNDRVLAQVLINPAFGDPKVYLTETTRDYQKAAGKTPIELAQGRLPLLSKESDKPRFHAAIALMQSALSG